LCHTFGRGEGKHQMVPGWPYSIVAVLETGRSSWTAVLDVVLPDADIIDINQPPQGQPGLHWVGPTESGTGIEWSRRSKFPFAAEWMAYLISKFLKPGAELARELQNPCRAGELQNPCRAGTTHFSVRFACTHGWGSRSAQACCAVFASRG
jgi:hypothetical protein